MVSSIGVLRSVAGVFMLGALGMLFKASGSEDWTLISYTNYKMSFGPGKYCLTHKSDSRWGSPTCTDGNS